MGFFFSFFLLPAALPFPLSASHGTVFSQADADSWRSFARFPEVPCFLPRGGFFTMWLRRDQRAKQGSESFRRNGLVKAVLSVTIPRDLFPVQDLVAPSQCSWQFWLQPGLYPPGERERGRVTFRVLVRIERKKEKWLPSLAADFPVKRQIF